MGLGQVCGESGTERRLPECVMQKHTVSLVASFPTGLLLLMGLGNSRVLWNLTPFVKQWS